MYSPWPTRPPWPPPRKSFQGLEPWKPRSSDHRLERASKGTWAEHSLGGHPPFGSAGNAEVWGFHGSHGLGIDVNLVEHETRWISMAFDVDWCGRKSTAMVKWKNQAWAQSSRSVATSCFSECQQEAHIHIYVRGKKIALFSFPLQPIHWKAQWRLPSSAPNTSRATPGDCHLMSFTAHHYFVTVCHSHISCGQCH